MTALCTRTSSVRSYSFRMPHRDIAAADAPRRHHHTCVSAAVTLHSLDAGVSSLAGPDDPLDEWLAERLVRRRLRHGLGPCRRCSFLSGINCSSVRIHQGMLCCFLPKRRPCVKFLSSLPPSHLTFRGLGFSHTHRARGEREISYMTPFPRMSSRIVSWPITARGLNRMTMGTARRTVQGDGSVVMLFPGGDTL